MITSQDVGHRVVVRQTAGVSAAGRQLFTDLLGDLVAMDAETLTVRTADGALHTIPLHRVALGKRIPPRPVRRGRTDQGAQP